MAIPLVSSTLKFLDLCYVHVFVRLLVDAKHVNKFWFSAVLLSVTSHYYAALCVIEVVRAELPKTITSN